MIDREAFEEWLAHPVTEHVMAVLRQRAEDNRQLWLAESWGTGIADQAQLNALRAIADAQDDLSKITYEDVKDEE